MIKINKKHLSIELLCGLCLGLVCIAACSATKNNSNLSLSQDLPQSYTKYCASCHGTNGESFRSRTFKHGSSLSEISTTIRDGYTLNGMPAYKGTLDNKTIQQLSAYIVALSSQPKIVPNSKSIFTSSTITIKLDTITTEVSVPWALEFLPDGSMLISDRGGDLYHRYTDGRMTKVQGLPEVHAQGQGGLLDILVHPDHSTNGVIFLSYSKPKRENNKSLSTTAVIRAKLQEDRLLGIKEIFEALPYSEANHHYGSRMVMDNNNLLYITVGDRGKENQNPQSLTSMCGKTHRINEDGTIPESNPFVGNTQAIASIYTYGHRNPQGIAINPATMAIWTNEHGPRGGDEINELSPALNFGWPLTCYGINYNGTKITDNTSLAGITDPRHYWLPSIGPSDGIFVTSDLYGDWKGDYLASSLSFGYLHRCKVAESNINGHEKLLENIGRMRSIKQGPDGFLYVGLENPGRVFRLRPLW